MNRNSWIFALLIPPFVKGFVYPGWQSSLELALFCSLVAIVLFRPAPKSLEARKVEQLEEKLESLNAQFTQLKIKIGFKM